MTALRMLQTTFIGALAVAGVLHWQGTAVSAPKSPPITGGYVLTHEHPTYGMAFGGNYAFAGKAGNYRNGVMEEGYTAECGGCGSSGKSVGSIAA